MKRILLLITFAALAFISRSQDTMYVHQKGGLITKVAVDKIDSILFKTSDSSIGKTIKGYAQKGPFINGSAITVFDLQANLSPSGRSFTEQITDNKGSFELNDIELSSNFVSIRTDGFYFNEVSGKQSASQITLYALADIAGKNNININLLTHLEKARVEYLMKEGKAFTEAKAQAQKEILAIFNIEDASVKVSESLNITEQGNDNGILLAISSIIQGFRTESEMTELLSNISIDIKTDGILNSAAVGSALINHAVALDTVAIRNNLIKRYNDIGATASIPYFGKYIARFVKNTPFVITQPLITYPETGLHGNNILSLTKTNFVGGMYVEQSLSAQLAKGTALKIKITSLKADSVYIPATDTTEAKYNIIKGMWAYEVFSRINWTVTTFDQRNYTQTFTAIEPDKTCDLLIFFEKGSYLIEYFEMNATLPTRQKIIFVKPE
ncbi:MAG TPA: hypothetical protein VFG54_10805 [Prolixibacteraceae bacterium]|nr:hypothetical protein [Prolixibacteraceae bacterium]